MKIFAIIVAVIILLVVIAYFILSFYAVKFIQAQIQAALGPDFTLTAVHVTMRDLTIRGITCQDPVLHRKTLEAAELKIMPSIQSLFKGKIVINDLIISDPYVYVIRSAKGKIAGPWSRLPAGKSQDPPPVTVARIEVKNCSIDFEDYQTGSTPALLRFRNLESTIGTIHTPPQPGQQTPVHVRTIMKGVQNDGTIFIYGWTDLANGDQSMTVNVNGMGVRTFEPYYRSKISTSIKSGTATLHMDMKVNNKIIDAPGELDLNGLSFNLGGPGVTSLMGILVPSNTLVTRLQEKDNNVKIPFRVQGNENSPKFSFQEAFLAEVAVKLVDELGIKPSFKPMIPQLLDTGVSNKIRNFLNNFK